MLPWVTDCDDGAAVSEKSGVAPQFENLKLAISVLQLKLPFAFKYSVVYQRVQSSTGSMLKLL